MCLSLCNYNPPAKHIMVLNKIDFLLCCAFQKCFLDRAVHTNIVHFFLECGGLDFSFYFNPCDPFGVTIGNFLLPDRLHNILEWFTVMFQSGKNVFINKHTILKV